VNNEAATFEAQRANKSALANYPQRGVNPAERQKIMEQNFLTSPARRGKDLNDLLKTAQKGWF